MFFLAASALLTFSLGDFKLESGRSIPDAKITYRTYGKRNADSSNIVVVPTWFNGASEDFAKFIGKDRLVDDFRYFVIVVDALGNGNASSPSNTPLAKGSKFPGIRIADMVESQRRLLQHLNISSVHAMLGVSMGGMQVFHWMVQHPNFMRKAVSIVSTPKMTEADVKLWSKAVPIGRAPANATPDANTPSSRFGFDKVLGMIAGGISQVPKYQQPFNPLRQFEAMVAHDVTKLTGSSLENAAHRIRAKTMIIIATKDNALTTDLSIRLAELLRAPLLQLEGPCGHKAYDCELDKIAAPIAQFLD